MATRNIVPRANGEGSIGTAAKHWGAGYFDALNLAGEGVAGTLTNMDLALAESTGYGIVSGCTPSISGLTVTVSAGIVHLAGGTRKELSATNITLDAADSTNPRIDLVYIDSTGVVAKVTGTAAASPFVPSVPSGGISVCNVTIAAGATTGTITDSRGMLPRFYNTGIVNVKDFGAIGDGVTDDTAAIQAALDKGGAVIIPSGTYHINTTGLIINSNTELIGVGYPTLTTKGNPYTDSWYYIIGTVGRTQSKITSNIIIRGIIFNQYQDDTSEVKEHVYILDLISVKNVLINECSFVGWYGDAICVGQKHLLHNENVLIQKCLFDGVTKKNRQGISVVDGSFISIINNSFKRTTDSTMPGAIDIEPDATDEKISNITIENNVFEDIGGTTAISISLHKDLAGTDTSYKNIHIRNNTVLSQDYKVGLSVLIYNGDGFANERDNNIFIEENNFTNCVMRIQGGKKYVVRDNTIIVSDTTIDKPLLCIGGIIPGVGSATDGTSNTWCSCDMLIENNWFKYTGGTAVRNPNVTFFNSINVLFKDNKSYGYFSEMNAAFLFGGHCATKNLRFVHNSSHTYDGLRSGWHNGTDHYFYKDTMEFSYNDCDEGPINYMNGNTSVYIRDLTKVMLAAPTAGRHYKGEIIYNMSPNPGNYVGWVCTVTGTPGTWNGFGTIES